jgi:adenosylcobinamide-GDP ribazoletransferase
MNGILAAVALLTALPLPGARRDIGAGLRWFSGVGLLLGGILAGTWWLANQAWQGSLVPAAITVAILAALTGMLHLDGLADAADAALVSASRDRRMAILKDVHHGTFAIVAVTVVLLLKVSALAQCSERSGVLLLAIVPACSRAALPLVVRAYPKLPSSSMATAAATGATTPALAIAIGVAVVPAVVLLGAAGAAVAAACFVTAVVTVGLLSRRFGGINGDCLGAAVELGETAGLLAGSALLAHVHAGGLWGVP